MIEYSEESLKEIFKNDEFLNDYEIYIEDNEYINKLINILDKIELNKKYFRLSIDKNIGHKKRYKNKNISEDTVAIKETHSLVNKCSDKNLLNITEKIKLKLKDKDHLSQLIIDSIIEKCVLNTIYIEIYLKLIKGIFNCKNLNDMIEISVNSVYEKMQQTDIDVNQSEYLQFCDKNQKLDKLIGYSLLITECEKMNILSDKIHPSLNNLIEILDKTEDDDEKYKCSQCLYNIFKSLYNDSKIPSNYYEKLERLKTNEKSMKIKFKYMDILERK